MAGRRLGQIRLVAELRETVSKLETRMMVEYAKRGGKPYKQDYSRRLNDAVLEAWGNAQLGICYVAQELDELRDLLAKRHPEQTIIAGQFTTPESASL